MIAWKLMLRSGMFALLLLAGPASVSHADEIYWGAYVEGGMADPSRLDALEARLGKQSSIVQWGEPWWHAGGYMPFQSNYFQTIRDRGSIPLIDWASWDYCCDEKQPRFQLRTIINGTHDAYIKQWAQAARAWGHPFFIRFDPEMNGWWSPWSEQVNGNQAGEFVSAWRHVVDIFRQQGVTNATWVWCPNIVGQRSTPLGGLYPGDDYVDWACMDGYNWGTDKGNSGYWSFADVFAGSSYNGYANTYAQISQLAAGKPIMVGETAASEHGGSKAAWITNMLTDALPNAFPGIKALLYFNWNMADPGISWPLASSAEAQAAFAQGIASSYYAGAKFGAIDGAPVRAPVTQQVVAPAAEPAFRPLPVPDSTPDQMPPPAPAPSLELQAAAAPEMVTDAMPVDAPSDVDDDADASE